MTPNPYSTPRARSSWQNGYEGAPVTHMDWKEHHARGVRDAARDRLDASSNPSS